MNPCIVVCEGEKCADAARSLGFTATTSAGGLQAANKTDRYDGKESRTIPLFPELRKYLEEAFELAEPGQPNVIGGDYLAKATKPTGWKSCNLRTTFGKLVKRAGLEPWPRLFHNLRSGRETELLEEFPLHVVAAWMGHDAKVSLKHYAQTTDEHFERATRAAESAALALQKAAQQPAAGKGNDSQTDRVNGDRMATCATPCESSRYSAHVLSGEGGIRTLDGAFRPRNFLAGSRFRPLSHLSGYAGLSLARLGKLTPKEPTGIPPSHQLTHCRRWDPTRQLS